MKKLLLSFSTLFLLPQCAHINKTKSFAPIEEESKRRIGDSPRWKEAFNPSRVSQKINNGLSILDAIGLGIDNNPRLQALFEDVGIRKADLLQAGFYSNPHIETIFRIPHNDDNRTSIEVDGSWRLSDLWQVPLRKKVAQDMVEIKTYEIISEILLLKKAIQQQYVDCIYHQNYVDTVKEITHTIQSLKKRIEYRYQFGFGTKLDLYFAASRLAQWHAKLIEAKAMLRNAYVSFRALLGGVVTDQNIELVDTLSIEPIPLSEKDLVQYALASHPLLIAEQAKIDRAAHSISYETSKIFDDVQIGFSYERDFEQGASGVGPSFGISLPFLDTNYGNIERAKYEKKQAEKTLFAQKQMLEKEIANRYISYQSYFQQIKEYEQNVLPPVMEGIAFSKEYFDKMQINLTVFLETQIELFQHTITLLELQRSALMEQSELEYAVGTRLAAITYRDK